MPAIRALTRTTARPILRLRLLIDLPPRVPARAAVHRARVRRRGLALVRRVPPPAGLAVPRPAAERVPQHVPDSSRGRAAGSLEDHTAGPRGSLRSHRAES